MLNQSNVTAIVCHNATFDRDVLMEVYTRHQTNLDERLCRKRLIFVDTLPIFKCRVKGLSKYDLGSVYEYLFNQRIENQHKAEPDVIAMEKILQYIADGNGMTVRELITERAKTIDAHLWHRNFDEHGILTNPVIGLSRDVPL